MDIEKGVLRIRHGTWETPTRLTKNPRYLQIMINLPDNRRLVADLSKLEWKEFPIGGTYGPEHTLGHFEICIDDHDEWNKCRVNNTSIRWEDKYLWDDAQHMWVERDKEKH